MRARRVELVALALVGGWVVQQAASDALVWDVVGYACALAAILLLAWSWRSARR